MTESSLKTRILFPVSLALALILGAFIYNVYTAQQIQLAQDVETQLYSVQTFFDKQLNAKVNQINGIINILAKNKELQTAFINGEREQLLSLSSPYLGELKDNLNLTHYYYHGADRKNFLRVYDPDRFGDFINRFTLLQAEKTLKPAAGIELGKLGTMTLRVVHPWFIKGELRGYIEMGEELDTFVQELHQVLGTEIYISIYKEYLEKESWQEGMRLLGRQQDWDILTSSVIVSKTPAEIPQAFDQFLRKGAHHYMEMDTELLITIAGKMYRIGVIPLFDAGDREIGDIVVLYDVSKQIAASKKIIFLTILACFGVGCFLFILFWRVLGSVENELTQHRLHLQDLVHERTEELHQSNQELEQEISERKKVEEQLKKAQTSLKKAQQIARIGNWEWDKKENRLWWSEDIYAMLSLPTLPEMNLKQFGEMVHPEDRDHFLELFEKIKSDQAPTQIEFRIIPPDGGEHVLLQQSEVLVDEQHEHETVVGTIQDVTERRQMEQTIQQSRNLDSLGVLAGGIAHDFNNLLTALLIHLQLAKESIPPDNSTYDMISLAENAGRRAAHLTGQLLTFSKGGTPKHELLPLNKIITETSSFVLSGSNIACQTDLKDDLWMISADRGQMEQVFHNLLINAKDAMPSGGTIKINTDNVRLNEDNPLQLGQGPYVRIQIIDEGEGMTEGTLSKIFDPYFTTKPKGARKGTGLGLSICHSIIRKHKGSITVDSTVGSGTTITLYLPADTAKTVVAQTSAQSEQAFSDHQRILIMDDEDIVLQASCSILRSMGFEPLPARNGDEAISQCRKAMSDGTPVPLAILDLTIKGGMGGMETIKHLHEIDPGMVAVVASGYSDTEVMANFANYGFAAAMAKPYNAEKFRDVINSVLPSKAHS